MRYVTGHAYTAASPRAAEAGFRWVEHANLIDGDRPADGRPGDVRGRHACHVRGAGEPRRERGCRPTSSPS